MNRVLSIQSHVAYGYVGNKVATFALQRLGCDVISINTVQFSNHTGYGSWQGDIMSNQHVQSVVDGVQERDVFDSIDAVLSGYMGDPGLGEVIVNTVDKVRQQNPETIYCCDPVIGDVGRGVFVKPETAAFIKDKAIGLADIATPNQFELEFLTGEKVDDVISAMYACQKLHALGPKIIVVTSLQNKDTPDDSIEMLLSTQDGFWKISTPKLEFDLSPNGAGDAVSAIFLAKYLESKDPVLALEHVTSAVYGIFEQTQQQQTRELQLVRAQDQIVSPSTNYGAKKL